MSGGHPLESHGGYLFRAESLGSLPLRTLAQQALVEDGAPEDTRLCVSVYPRRKIIRLALESALTAGEGGARWYSTHHALARNLSRAAGVTVHTYVYAAREFEEVIAYGRGQHVGGERLAYDQVELPEGADGEFDDAAFARMQSRWPVGHLAWVFGVERELLLRLPQMSPTRLGLQGPGPELSLEHLLSGIAA